MRNPFRKKIKLDLYTCDGGYYLNDRPTKQMDQATWLKDIKNTVTTYDDRTKSSYQLGTVKGCPGIKNLMTEGIKFHLWEQVKFRIHPDGTAEILPLGFESKHLPMGQHYVEQIKGLYPKNSCAIKLNTPWQGKCNEDINFLFMESHYSTGFFRENNAYIAPGYINFKYQHALNVHVVLPTDDKPYEIEFPYGLPLFTLYPITERELEIDYHKLSYDEFIEITNSLPMCPWGRYYQYLKNIANENSR
tara:strand:+ start:505 stop:1245 length:741 start_codon:yes stop_codon:yes gene_type:complete